MNATNGDTRQKPLCRKEGWRGDTWRKARCFGARPGVKNRREVEQNRDGVIFISLSARSSRESDGAGRWKTGRAGTGRGRASVFTSWHLGTRVCSEGDGGCEGGKEREAEPFIDQSNRDILGILSYWC